VVISNHISSKPCGQGQSRWCPWCRCEEEWPEARNCSRREGIQGHITYFAFFHPASVKPLNKLVFHPPDSYSGFVS